jgi:hypothetical protein
LFTIGAAICAVGAAQGEAPALQAQQEQALTVGPVKWEYKTMDRADAAERTLNELGQQGWELVTSGRGELILKRPVR